MGIVNRFSRAIRAHLDDLRMSPHPEQVIDQAIEEMRAIERATRQDLTSVRGSQKRLRAEAERLAAEAKRWEERATLALRSHDELLAREALRQKLALDRTAAAVRDDADQHGVTASELERTLTAIEREATSLTARKGALVAEVLAARAASKSAPSAEFSRTSERIAALEAEVEAERVLHDPEQAKLAARFQALEQRAEADIVEDELRSLKELLARND